MKYKISICHIIDNEKFINEAIKQFRQYPDIVNDFYCIVDKPKIDFLENNLGIANIHLEEINSFVKNTLQSYNVVIFHNFNQDYKYKILKSLRKDQICVWIGWGYDLYRFFNKDYYLTTQSKPFVKKIYEQSLIKKISNYFRLGNIKYWALWHLIYKSQLSHLANRVNYYAPPIPYEYTLLKNLYPTSSVQYLTWNYSYKLIDLHLKSKTTSTLQILIGNSASATNNHYDIISKLSLYDDDFIAHIPLSYGGDNLYKKGIIEVANFKLGDRVNIIEQFLPFDEYSRLMSNCQIGIFNSIRQQAMGNIIFLLYNGSKVFMNPSCSFFRFLLDNNVIVHSLDDLSKEHLNTELTQNEKSSNKQILNELYGLEALKIKTNLILQTLANNFFQ